MSAEALISIATTNNIEVIKASKKPDVSYSREWRKFKDFITLNRSSGHLDTEGLFITRENIDFYFATKVANLTQLSPESARRIVPAIQFFADFEEYANARERFIVDGPVVLKALECHGAKWREVKSNKYTDPHADLPTNVLTYEEHRKALLYMIPLPEWRDLTFTWSTCRSTFIRNVSSSRMLLS